jgi:hypothetical protein
MNSNTIIGIVVGVIVVLGAGYYLFTNMGSSAVENTEQGAAVEQSSDKKMAFADFVKQGGSYKCTVTQSFEGTQTQGTTYIDNGKIRGEYTAQVQGMSIDAAFIVKDGYTYSWSSAMPNMGFKVKVDETAGDTGATASGTYSYNGDQIGDYNCESWTADASKFALPAGVTFQAI